MHHEVFDYSVKGRSLVADRHTVFAIFSRAELAKVFRSFGDDVCKKLHFDAAHGLAAYGNIEEHDGIAARFCGHFLGILARAREREKVKRSPEILLVRGWLNLSVTMSVNLKKNEAALQAAYKDVLSNSTDTDW